jgi:hypothetical protein
MKPMRKTRTKRNNRFSGAGILHNLYKNAKNYTRKLSNKSYVKKILYYNGKEIDIDENVKNHINNFIREHNINNTKFYNKLIQNMKENEYVFKNTLENKAFLNVLKEMNIVDNIDKLYLGYRKPGNIHRNHIDDYITKYEKSGKLFVFGKGFNCSFLYL